MARLTPSELAKLNSRTGQPRLEILKSLVKDGVPLELYDGTSIVVTDIIGAIEEIDNFTGKSFVLTGVIGGRIVQRSSSDLEKTAEFGGGSGIGVGSKQTDINEAAQAAYCSSVARCEPVLTTKGYIAQITRDEILELRNDWVISSVAIAKYLHLNKITNKNQVFHHRSGFIDDLLGTAKELMILEGLPWSKDKWNPSDIWAVSGSPNIKSKSIWELNNKLKKLLIDGELVGISLKKVEGDPIHEFVNMIPAEIDLDIVDYGIVSSFKSPDFFSSKKIMVCSNLNVVHGRTYDPLKNWSLEIEGRLAKHGKIGKGPVSRFLESYGHGELPEHSMLLSECQNPSKGFLESFYEIYRRNPPWFDRLTQAEFSDRIIQMSHGVKGQDWIYSKFIGCDFIDKIRVDKGPLEGIILYAMSQSKFSGPFVKVYQE